jgi:hypothetical protein
MVDAKRVEGATVCVALILETVSDEMVAVCENIVRAVRVEIATCEIVAVGWMTGTHCPNI